jgi:hypothetical protein
MTRAQLNKKFQDFPFLPSLPLREEIASERDNSVIWSNLLLSDVSETTGDEEAGHGEGLMSVQPNLVPPR